MKKNWLSLAALLAPLSAAAHPGHGLPGWIHPHAGDYGLALLAIVVVAAALFGLKKRRAKK